MERGGGWSVYRDALFGLFRADRIAFANVIPWGSHVAGEFFSPMNEKHGDLLGRLLCFAGALNERVVTTMRPRLVVLPWSLVDSRFTTALGLRPVDLEEHRIPVAGRQLRFATGTLLRGSEARPALVGPHPSALRPRKEERAAVVAALAACVGRRWPDLPTGP